MGHAAAGQPSALERMWISRGAESGGGARGSGVFLRRALWREVLLGCGLGRHPAVAGCLRGRHRDTFRPLCHRACRPAGSLSFHERGIAMPCIRAAPEIDRTLMDVGRRETLSGRAFAGLALRRALADGRASTA